MTTSGQGGVGRSRESSNIDLDVAAADVLGPIGAVSRLFPLIGSSPSSLADSPGSLPWIVPPMWEIYSRSKMVGFMAQMPPVPPLLPIPSVAICSTSDGCDTVTFRRWFGKVGPTVQVGRFVLCEANTRIKLLSRSSECSLSR